MIIVASENGAIGAPAAWSALEAGASALEAVEVAISAVEDNPEDHTVGYGGHPNIEGVVELDASIMEGSTRRAGAVGSLRGFRHAITVARAVMDRTPHVLIAGTGAADLAREIGLFEEELLTDDEREAWRSGLARGEGNLLAQVAMLTRDPRDGAGTVDVLAMDRTGSLASGVSTSGWAFKHPGRIADSAVIGAGNYCDDRYGAAACTGWGELAIRATTARSVVMAMGRGASPRDAALEALADLPALAPAGVHPLMHIVALAPSGEHVGATNWPGSRYSFQSPRSAGTVIADRVLFTT